MPICVFVCLFLFCRFIITALRHLLISKLEMGNLELVLFFFFFFLNFILSFIFYANFRFEKALLLSFVYSDALGASSNLIRQ